MFFVTDNPILFNVENGTTLAPIPSMRTDAAYEVRLNNIPVFAGSRQECEDFIYSIAGWVGAVNPVTLEKETRK